MVIVDDAFARRFWTGHDAIGKRMRFTGDTTWLTMWVAGTVRRPGCGDQRPCHTPIAVRTGAGNSANAGDHRRTAIRRRCSPKCGGALADSSRVRAPPTCECFERGSAGAGEPRMTEISARGLTLLALLLAVISIYGVIDPVTSRVERAGSALASQWAGPEPSHVVRLILREGLILGVRGDDWRRRRAVRHALAGLVALRGEPDPIPGLHGDLR